MLQNQIRTLTYLPKQVRYLKSNSRHLLYSGGLGSGKTRALCTKLVMRASVPGARELLLRKTNTSLKATTLRTLLESDGDLPPVLPQGSYTLNKADQIIRIHGGGSIQWLGCDDPLKLGSLPATGAGVDEILELKEDDYNAISGRIRVKIPGLVNQVYSCTNPGSPLHFLAIRFGLGTTPAFAESEAICTSTPENFFLPKSFILDQSRLTGVAKARLFEGRWVVAEGSIFPDLLDAVIRQSVPPPGETYAGLDWGWKDPKACLAVRHYKSEDDKDTLYAYFEKKVPQCPLDVFAQYLKQLPSETIFFYDTASPESARDLRKFDFNLQPAEKGISYGIDVVNALIANGQLFFSSDLVETLIEAGSYVWNNTGTKEVPMKGLQDHLMDCLRYVCGTTKSRGIIQ